MTVKLAPSILSADFTRLGDQVKDAERAGADMIHIDVMDGHFVPPITMGPLVVEAVNRVTELPLDVHLMIEHPDRSLQVFAEAGADIAHVHIEACTHLHRTVHAIKELGMRAGVVLNPATPASDLRQILGDVDVVMVMTVNPGYPAQNFIMSQIEKIERIRAMLDEADSDADLEVDGGVHSKTAPLCVGAGANVLVAGSAIFDHERSVDEAVKALRASIAADPSSSRVG